MLSYAGNGPYCYANSAAMLLESAGESVEPRLVEVLSGVGLGAIWVAESQTLFLSGLASAPDVGLSRSFRLLGFRVVEEAEADGDAIPIDALKLQLGKGRCCSAPSTWVSFPIVPMPAERTVPIILCLLCTWKTARSLCMILRAIPPCPSASRRSTVHGGPT